ncbi:class II aldolase/adducin family protein [Christensenellaceae bacterium OttesenSCG-928-M15]|nr:class II aldolase/adducin family protein [Christensenellaceae bacterium OttesenSCG-928-M15]
MNNEFLKSNETALAAFARMSMNAGARADYVQGGGGNTSVKLKDGWMAIKASGYKLCDIRPDAAYAVLDHVSLSAFYMTHEPEALEDVEKQGAAMAKAAIKQIEGLEALRPSVEAGFHSLLDTYVLHSHSVYANLAACAKETAEICEKAFAGADYAWAIASYVDPGARLTFEIRDAIREVEAKTGKRPAVILMQNHGLIVHHDDAKECEHIHDDVNRRIAAVFQMSATSFPAVQIKPTGEGVFVSDTPELIAALQSGEFSEEFLLRQPLYPDQLVFLNGTLFFGGEPKEGCCALDEKSGVVTYRMQEGKARVIEETLMAVVFIVRAIQEAKYTLSVMGEAAKAFIANWESEQYRKSLAGK